MHLPNQNGFSTKPDIEDLLGFWGNLAAHAWLMPSPKKSVM
jgi:hypothetical protein